MSNKIKFKTRSARFQFEDIDKLNKIKQYLYNYMVLDNLPTTKENKENLYNMFNEIYFKIIKE